MKRRRRTEILIQGNINLAKQLAQEIIDRYPVREISPPEYGLTMLKMRETAKNSLFYMGEVLMTEAKAEINQQIGIGMVIGMQEELAQHLAVIDAAYKAELPETKTWEELLLQEEERIYKDKVKQQQEILKTKVDFDTMDVQ